MRLQDKFKKVFILPLIFGIILSLVITSTVLIFYSKNIATDDIIQIMHEMEMNITEPIFESAKLIIQKKFQHPINSLRVFKNYYFKFAQQVNQTNVDLLNMSYLKYMYNGMALGRNSNYFNYIINEEMTVQQNTTFLDHATWWVDNIHTTIGSLKEVPNRSVILKELYNFVMIIPALRNIWEISEYNTFNRFDLIYYASRLTNVMITYPIFTWKENFYQEINTKVMPSYCKDKNGNTPKFYYFQCREWWVSIMNSLQLNNDNDIVISRPYKWIGDDGAVNNFGVTICLKFNNTFVNYESIDTTSAICVDVELKDMMLEFDSYNNQLIGYFFVLKIQSDTPLYYPMISQNPYFSNIQRFEFDINNTYYLEDLEEYNKLVYNLTAQQPNDSIRKSDTSINLGGGYRKNGIANDYYIIRNYLNVNKNNPNQRSHLISIIYVTQKKTIKDYLMAYSDKLLPLLITQFFEFIIIVSVLVLISWHLIMSIANNILIPIRNLKNQIKGLNTNTNINLAENLDVPIKHENKILEKDDDIPKEEEITLYRSVEMDKLFNILLELKNVLTFTSSKRTLFEEDVMLNFINANYSFKEVKNDKGNINPIN